ncbi:MAG: acetyl-coenzyme A synthetase N-terminal domain-containing protein, partial [Desulfovibrio sp.]
MSDEKIQSLSHESRIFQPPANKTAAISSMEEYERIYKRSIEDMDGFWAERAGELLTWDKPWDRVLDWNFDTPDIKWFSGGRLNVAYNCLDRHLENGR